MAAPVSICFVLGTALPSHGREGFPYIVGKHAPCPGYWVDDLALEPEPARLETIETVDKVDVLSFFECWARQNLARNALCVDRQRGRPLHAQWGIEDTDLHGAEFGLRADIPVEVLHAADYSGCEHFGEVSVELGPVTNKRHAAAQRKRGDGVHPGTVEGGIGALRKR